MSEDVKAAWMSMQIMEQRARIEALKAALRKIAGRDEYAKEDYAASTKYKLDEGMWTVDEYLADAALDKDAGHE